MLRRLRLRRSLWAAVAAGLVAAPALLGGVAAAPADPHEMLPPPEPDPRDLLPPDPAQIEAELLLRQTMLIADLAPEEFRPLVVAAANQHAVDPRLLAAIATVESEWKPNAVGGHGERGIMQILPSTGAWLARTAGLEEYNLADTATSLDLAARYMAMLIVEYETPEKALSVYNGGPRAAKSWETNGYARKVMGQYYKTPGYAIPLGLQELAS